MEQLIKIETNENNEQLVSGRELHCFLEIKKPYTDWIKLMFEYGFVENIDYIQLSQKSESSKSNNNKQINHMLKIDMAKEIAMIQRSEKGKQARLYFIECEKKLKENSLPQSYAEALLEAGRLALEVEEKNKQLIEQAPKVEFFDTVADSKDAIEMKEVAKVLNIPKLGRNKLFEILRNKNILDKTNAPYQTYIDRGYFRRIEQKYTDKSGEIHIVFKTLVYQKGVDYIRKVVNKDENND